MKALSTTTNSSSAKSSSSDKDALLSTEDLRTIFHCIPELYKVHSAFLGGLKAVEHGYKMKLHSESMTGKSKVATKLMTKNSVGELFFRLASNLPIYADFLRNYSRALETAGRCSAQSSKFSEIIKVKSQFPFFYYIFVIGTFTLFSFFNHSPSRWPR